MIDTLRTILKILFMTSILYVLISIPLHVGVSIVYMMKNEEAFVQLATKLDKSSDLLVEEILPERENSLK